MNSGQMMIGILAMGLVTMIILNFNKGTMHTQDALIYNKEFILATTIAQSILDEVGSRSYDEKIVNGDKIYSANDFSNNLKADGETYPNFDDIDDFNNFSKTDTIPQMGIFNVLVEVDYYTDALAKTTAKTYNKNVTIYVTSTALVNFYTNKQDTLVLTSLFSQWVML